MGFAYSAASIESECQRLGHRLGWRLLTCPEKNIDTATVALITINPGGAQFEPPRWSVEAGSAYVIERWKGRAPGEERLQRQVKRMFEIVGTDPGDALTGYLVPFRSPTWADLSKKSESLEFGFAAWREIFRRAKLKTVLAFGKDVAPFIARLLAATLQRKHPAGWGEQTIDSYSFNDGKLVVLPHLARFAIFNRTNVAKSEEAFRSALISAD